MTDNELSKFTTWRFTNVKAGDKVPYPNGWQKKPLLLEQITSTNIGLLLGEPSGGIMAIDFDGTTAWEWFEQNIGCPLPPTPVWSSGKPDRCQMAFQVPMEAWELLRPKKVVTKQPSVPGAGDGEGIEFRWNGNQSVLPPSRLDDGRQYMWYNLCDVAELPIEILEKWVELINTVKEREEVPYVPVSIDDLTDEVYDDVREILETLKRHSPTLSYDQWFTVTCATANALGDTVAEVVLQELWAENKRGEYRQKIRSRDPAKSGGVGSLVYLVRQYEPNYRRSKADRNSVDAYTNRIETATNKLQSDMNKLNERMKKWRQI